MSQVPCPETLDFILDYTRDGPKRQLDASQSIDGKSLQTFAAASIVIALAAAGPLRQGAPAWFYGGALGAYLVAACAAFYVLRVRAFRVVDDANQIWSRYWNVELREIKHALVDDIASAYAENASLLGSKAAGLKVLVGSTTAEVVLIGLAVIASLV